MFDIYLSEKGHSGLFSAKSLVRTIGTLSFRFTGPLTIIVESLDVQAGLTFKQVAYKLLDAMHEYAYYKDCKLRFRCPKAKAINDQQIAQELSGIALLDNEAA